MTSARADAASRERDRPDSTVVEVGRRADVLKNPRLHKPAPRVRDARGLFRRQRHGIVILIVDVVAELDGAVAHHPRRQIDPGRPAPCAVRGTFTSLPAAIVLSISARVHFGCSDSSQVAQGRARCPRAHSHVTESDNRP